ncbi:protein Bouncer isoform X2 [Salmo trutta]|uniref:protein Bouncer isoform X2 n=1 Tax=Salmo trutta TaxID=8032 RepID=UPI001131A0FB|nr:protein Bouncer-like isoform X2 [Salmo trutta]
MNKFMWGCVALVGLFVVAESLKCNTCTVGMASLCFIGSTAECSTSEPNCFTAVAEFNATKLLNLKRKGCMATALCNTTSTGSILTADYTVTQTCCSTDQCNGAVAIQLPLTVALGAALVAIWSTFS